MLSRLLPKATSHFRALTLISSKAQTLTTPQTPPFRFSSRFFSSDGDGGGGDGDGRRGDWNLSETEPGSFGYRFPGGDDSEPWTSGGGDTWHSDDDLKPWDLAEEEDDGGEVKGGLFDIDADEDAIDVEAKQAEIARAKEEEAMRLQREEQALTAILKGPRRAFGDLITASGITEEMIDSLIALKDFKGVEGLPPLKDLEELRKEKGKRKSSEAEKERLKQEEAAKARVRQVDENGRAYGTGRRKCSVARVWIQPGDGKFVVNGKDFDVYFPILDYRAALLRPFSETKTLGLWDVKCTVKGGGVTGQCGAILLGISRALQNWEPDLRPPLKAVGFLTRDPRMVERKKPGKAKARKSFQWVKR